MNVVHDVAGPPCKAPAVSETQLEAVRDLYVKCFREVIAEIIERNEPFGNGELFVEVEERFDSRLKLERKLKEWFDVELKQLLSH